MFTIFKKPAYIHCKQLYDRDGINSCLTELVYNIVIK